MDFKFAFEILCKIPTESEHRSIIHCHIIIPVLSGFKGLDMSQVYNFRFVNPDKKSAIQFFRKGFECDVAKVFFVFVIDIDIGGIGRKIEHIFSRNLELLVSFPDF